MTPDEIKSAITGWSNQGTGLQLVEDRSEPGADFVLGLRSAAHGSAGTVPVEVRLDQGGDRLAVTSRSTSAASSSEIRALLDSRPASVHADTSNDGTVITSHVYTDGFSRHALTRAVDEVAKTRALVDGLAGTAGAGRSVDSGLGTGTGTGLGVGAGAGLTAGAGLASGGSAAEDSREAEPSWSQSSSLPASSSFPSPASSLPAPSFGSPTPTSSATPASTGYSPLSGQPAPQAQPASSAFAPTHTVPPQGMQAWAAPDPNGAVVATLGGGLPIQITEVRGAWAHVLCSNGWAGWVDGRIIGVAR